MQSKLELIIGEHITGKIYSRELKQLGSQLDNLGATIYPSPWV